MGDRLLSGAQDRLAPGRPVDTFAVRSERRFSQAIAEGDGISVIADVEDHDAARAATAQGAEAIAVRGSIGDLRAVTELPILWRSSGSPSEAALAGADAWLVAVEDAGEDEEWLARQQAEAIELGLDCVVEVRSEEELELALERLDPEIFLLAADNEEDGDALGRALELLPDIPAGKLAVADVQATSREQVDELERAGVDAVIVGARSVAELVGVAPPKAP
jgi:indole-3-glycerol phosphate synthase